MSETNGTGTGRGTGSAPHEGAPLRLVAEVPGVGAVLLTLHAAVRFRQRICALDEGRIARVLSRCSRVTGKSKLAAYLRASAYRNRHGDTVLLYDHQSGAVFVCSPPEGPEPAVDLVACTVVTAADAKCRRTDPLVKGRGVKVSGKAAVRAMRRRDEARAERYDAERYDGERYDGGA